jgi:DNA-binding IclR family transcriptional regulator
MGRSGQGRSLKTARAVLRVHRLLLTAPRIAGLGERVQREAHAVAFGKVLLAFGGAPALATHAGAFGLTPFTPATITDPLRLAAELVGVRRLGFALDRQEFDPRFCCVSAPILAADGRPAGALALSVPAAHFGDEGPALVEVVRQVAAQAGSA